MRSSQQNMAVSSMAVTASVNPSNSNTKHTPMDSATLAAGASITRFYCGFPSA